MFRCNDIPIIVSEIFQWIINGLLAQVSILMCGNF